MRFREGQRVRVVGREPTTRIPILDMDELQGTVGTIRSVWTDVTGTTCYDVEFFRETSWTYQFQETNLLEAGWPEGAVPNANGLRPGQRVRVVGIDSDSAQAEIFRDAVGVIVAPLEHTNANPYDYSVRFAQGGNWRFYARNLEAVDAPTTDDHEDADMAKKKKRYLERANSLVDQIKGHVDPKQGKQDRPTDTSFPPRSHLDEITSHVGSKKGEQKDMWDSEYSWPRPGGTYRPTGFQGASATWSPPAPAGLILLLKKDGLMDGPFSVPSTEKDWWEVASKTYPPVDGKMVISIEHVGFSYSTPPFYACTYDACDKYLSSRWGQKLDDTDRRWLAAHPLATDNGIPFEYTAICLQALLEPYGFGVSRIRVRSGSLALGDHAMQFLQALGCNPMGMADRKTTNAEAAAQMGLTLADADKVFRFEYHDDPLPGSIIGSRASSSAQSGYGGGHATYHPPRGSAGDWVISLQLAPIDQITYLVPIVLPEYTPRAGARTLLLSSVKTPDGGPVAIRQGNWWKAPGDIPVLANPSPTSTPPSLPASDRAVTPSSKGASSEVNDVCPCRVCGQPTKVSDFEDGTDACVACYNRAWAGYNCPECRSRYQGFFNPRVLERDNARGVTLFECPKHKCSGQFEVDDVRDAKTLPELVAISKVCVDERQAARTDMPELPDDPSFPKSVRDEMVPPTEPADTIISDNHPLNFENPYGLD